MMTALRRMRVRARPQAAPAPALPNRERVRGLANRYHRQLLDAPKQRATCHQVIRAQSEALHQFALDFTTEQADAFMNMYTEERSAVEREWQAKRCRHRVQEPLSPTLVRVLLFSITLFAIALAIRDVV